jgi:hypothetical protein
MDEPVSGLGRGDEQEFQMLRAGLRHLAEVQRLSGFENLWSCRWHATPWKLA